MSKDKSFGWFEVSWHSFVLQIQSEHMSKIKIYRVNSQLAGTKKEGSFCFTKRWAWLIKTKGCGGNGYRMATGIQWANLPLKTLYPVWQTVLSGRLKLLVPRENTSFTIHHKMKENQPRQNTKTINK